MRAHTLAAIRVAFKRFKRGMEPQALKEDLEAWLADKPSLDSDDLIVINGIIEAMAKWPDDAKGEK